MKHPTEHKQTKKRKNTPRDLGPEDITVHTRDVGPDVQQCGGSNVACKGSTANLPKEQRNSKNLTLVVEEGSCQADLEYRQLREPCLQGT